MSITSFRFIVLVITAVFVYYIVPKKLQWMVLLLASVVFYCLAATPYTIIYLVASTLVAYVSTLLAERLKKRKPVSSKRALVITLVAIFLNISTLLLINGKKLWAPVAGIFIQHIYISKIDTLININIVAAMGMGYYTLQIVGYIIDCYWENIQPQSNPLKLFLFTSYFPQLTTGPISRYEDLSTLYERHGFKYQNIAFGTQRILWGFVKKLVLAERVGAIVAAISAASGIYSGFYSWIAILLYPLQMYADFSGCMDIVLGVSELFDVHLAENFRNPFFSRSSQEFWQRWHITLGTWAKDYVLYPLLKSKPMIHMGKITKKKFGKKTSKFLVNLVGMFVLWMVMGLWHGGYRYIVGVSLWYWMILMSGELLSPLFGRINTLLHVKTESFSWRLFQSARTYLIYAIGATFFYWGISKGFALLKDALKVIAVKNYANPWIFFDGSIVKLGITHTDINIIIIATVLLMIAGVLREKYEYARYWVANQSFPFRWLIWFVLFLFVLIWGKYGPGYSASLFIYQGF